LDNKIVLRKTTSAIFLAIVLVLGTIALSSSFMKDVTAQQELGINNNYENHYGKDNYKSKDSNVSIKKLNCNNINANLNNIDASFGSQVDTNGNTDDAADGEALAALEGNEAIAANGLGNSGDSDNNRVFVDRQNDFVFVCINNNDNVVVVDNKTTPEEPEPTTGTLTVTKQFTCNEGQIPNSISIQQAVSPCQVVEELINEDDYIINVEGNNPSPSQFPGSSTGTDVTLGPGDYVITEPFPNTGIERILFTQFPNIVAIGFFGPVFTGDCTSETIGFLTRGIGTIEAGESQTCNLSNSIIIEQQSTPVP
jgi:hypothetical protein